MMTKSKSGRIVFCKWTLLVPAFFMIVVAQLTWPRVSGTHPDLNLYRDCAEKIAAGLTPYRDFQIEYPPLALVPCVIPWMIGKGQVSADSYRFLFLAANAVYLIAIAGATFIFARRVRLSSWRCIGALSLYAGVTAPLVPWRYDLFPAMLTAFALLAVSRNRPLATGIFLGFGIAAKLYPIVVLPVIGVYYMSKREWRPMWILVAGCAGTVFLVALPFYLIAGDGLLVFLHYHQQRGVQIESVTGGLFMLVCVLQHGFAPIGLSYGAWHLHSPFSDALAPLHSILFVSVYALFLGIAYSRFRLSKSESQESRLLELSQLCAAALLIFMLTNKVLSPQYLAWLFPFAALFPIRQAIWFVGVGAITMVIVPFCYGALLSCELWAVILLNLRNAMMVVLLIWICLSREECKPTPHDSRL